MTLKSVKEPVRKVARAGSEAEGTGWKLGLMPKAVGTLNASAPPAQSLPEEPNVPYVIRDPSKSIRVASHTELISKTDSKTLATGGLAADRPLLTESPSTSQKLI